MSTTSLVDDAQAELDAAHASHDDAEAALVELKTAFAADENVAAAVAAVLEGVNSGLRESDPDAFEQLVFAEELASEPHLEALAAAYAEFGRVAAAEHNVKRANAGLKPKKVVSNPAPADSTTQIDAHVVVNSDFAHSGLPTALPAAEAFPDVTETFVAETPVAPAE
jgi:hypothetical protein